MRARFVTSLCGTLICAATALAADLPVGPGWNVDISTARVLRLDPIVIGGGLSSDRILFDAKRDSAKGILSISCATKEYSLWAADDQLLVGVKPLSDWPLAAQLAETYCAKIDHLPQAGEVVPLDTKFE